MVMHIANLVAYHRVVEGIRVAATVAQRYAFVHEQITVKIHFEKEKRIKRIVLISRLGFCVRANDMAVLHKSGSQLYFGHADVRDLRNARLVKGCVIGRVK